MTFDRFYLATLMSMRIVLGKSMVVGPVSGADEVMLNYAIHLHRAGHTVTVVLLYPPARDDQYYLRLRQAGVKVTIVIRTSLIYPVLRTARNLFLSLFFFGYLVPGSFQGIRKIWQFMNRLLSRLYARRCRNVFARLRPDVLHIFTPDAGAILMIQDGHELGIPVLYHEMGTPDYLPALDAHYRELANALPMCDEFAVLSPRLRTHWSEKFPFLKSLSVLPLIVEDCDQRGAQLKTEAIETRFGYAARIEEGKGPLVLADALARLNRERTLGIVRMAGTGPQLPAVKARARELGLADVWEFVGFYSDPTARSIFMRSLDVFVLPTLAEGTPNSVIEAMAHGLPVIASAVGGIPDLLSEDSGILVPPGDEEALAQAMLRLASDSELRTRMGHAARQRYLQLFAPAAVLPILESTYRRLASRRKAQLASAGTKGLAHPWEKVVAEL
jgi:glycosyltransferase involved in cell wall biosynthesis